MSATISYFGGSLTPTLVLGWDPKRESGSRVHDLVGGGVDVTFGAARSREGRLQALFESQAAADTCVAVHATPGLFTLTVTADPAVTVVYVVGEGDIEAEFLTETSVWVVSFPYREIPT